MMTTTTTVPGVKEIFISTTPEAEAESAMWRQWIESLTTPYSFTYSFNLTLDNALSFVNWHGVDLLRRWHYLTFERPMPEMPPENAIAKLKDMLAIWAHGIGLGNDCNRWFTAESNLQDFLDALDGRYDEWSQLWEMETDVLRTVHIANTVVWAKYKRRALDEGVDYMIEAYLDGTPYEMIAANWEA